MSEIASEPYFYGSSQCRLGPKGQVAFPKCFRDVLPDEKTNLVILPGAAECLYIYTYRQFSEVRERAKKSAVKNNDPEFFRRFMEQVCSLELDTQNRMVISRELREIAGINGQDVLFIGMDARIEVWEPARREKFRNETEFIANRRQQAREIFGI